jgi:hypothetical protein
MKKSTTDVNHRTLIEDGDRMGHSRKCCPNFLPSNRRCLANTDRYGVSAATIDISRVEKKPVHRDGIDGVRYRRENAGQTRG